VIPDSIQINLYRIAQEALNNAIRHGKPKNISVQLVHSEGEILFIVEDDGIGFDTDNLQSEGLGLRSMKTRVGAMSANLDIVSTIGRGTIISVVVPLK
jgi:signal transduction histidine kinase